MLHTSSFWKAHFATNLTKQRIDWSVPPQFSENDRKNILYSLKAFQLAETGDGQVLLRAAAKFANKTGDHEYLEAIRLFIKEEQKHGANLGRYLDLIGEPRLQKDWGDSLFRKVRHFNTSMELWTLTVIIVECAAQVFYQALHDATECPLLKSICHDLLVDEAHHIKFQNERLHQVFARKGFYNKAFSLGWYSLFFFGIIHAVWIGHRKAMKAGGVNRNEFMRQMYFKFIRSLQFIHRKEALGNLKPVVV